ncbi:MAG: hypothetical protein ACJ71Y_11605 [Blastococcus sp.]|jgi:hypothetical protein
MRVRTTAATAALLLAALTACGGGGDGASASKTKASATPSSSKSVDCTSQTLSQSDYMEHCAGESSTGAEGKSTGLKFGESYTWPDGLKVTVVKAKVFTDYDKELLESAEPGKTDFRVELKLENTGKAPAALDDLSTIIEGATNGGEAASTSFENGSEPLEGRLAPGVSVVKNDDNVLESKYGKKIVVTVQRSSEDFTLDFPEFEGEITG